MAAISKGLIFIERTYLNKERMPKIYTLGLTERAYT
jgi:hypothetical protein